jgi:hypothetical protein
MSNRFEVMSDRDLFAPGPMYPEELPVLQAEREKRLRAKEQERQGIEQERLERIRQRNALKDALSFSDELATEICERIASGELLTVMCLDEHMPTVRRVNSWLREHTDFKALYDQSLQDRLNIFEEQIIQIPDEASRDFDVVKSKGSERRVLDPGKLQAAKLRVEVRRMHLKALRPQRWADVSTLITKSDDFDTSGMSAEELERQIADIEHKSRVTRAA